MADPHTERAVAAQCAKRSCAPSLQALRLCHQRYRHNSPARRALRCGQAVETWGACLRRELLKVAPLPPRAVDAVVAATLADEEARQQRERLAAASAARPRHV